MLLEYFKDLIFPIFCLECGKEGSYWCTDCQQKFPAVLVQFQPTTIGQEKNYLDNLLVFFNYDEDGVIARLIKQFKYQYVLAIAEIWKNIIHDGFSFIAPYAEFSLLPVPLHPRRERERGFNQAEEIAKIVHSEPDWRGQIESGLKRVRCTPQQAALPRSERLINLREAFAWQGGQVPARVLLVDDVYTTGATLNECAKVMKGLGSQEVFGLVLAKGGL